jgi:LPXTG-motif cell wall-anchored protein
MNRANEGGSVLSFVVIGGILSLLLVGGVYFVRQQMTAEADTKPQTVSEPQATPPENEPDTQNNDKAAEKNDQKTSAESSKPNNAAPQSSASATLPQTGPAESITAVLAVAFLSATFTAYVRSRREYVSL